MIVGITINPDSGKGRGALYREQMEGLLAAYPVDLMWFSDSEPGVARENMRRAVDERSIDALIVAGGDGMIHGAVNALGDSGIPLGIVATGSGNDIAREFKLPTHKPDEGLHQVMSALFVQKFRMVDVIEIEHSGGKERAMAMVNLGLDADANWRTNLMRWPKGNLRYVRGLINALAAYKPYGITVSAGGVTRSGSMALLCAANTRYAGGGFALAPDASPTDGLLDVVLARGLGALEFAEVLPKVSSGAYVNDPRAHVLRVRELNIDADPCAGSTPPPVMADGEYICQLPATIRILPQRIRMAL